MKKIKNNVRLIVIIAMLFGLGAKNVVSAVHVATVANTRYEIYYVMGGTNISYTYKELRYPNGFTYSTTRERKDYGVNPAYLYTYHYKTY